MADERFVEMVMIRERPVRAVEEIARAAAISQFSIFNSQFTPAESQ
jgi:hypothetical protein